MERRLRVLWLTNLAPPYRLPVWESLGHHLDLLVGLLEPNSRFKKDTGANRGTDWEFNGGEAYQAMEFSTLRIKAGEARYYGFPNRTFVPAVGGADVVLLAGWESPSYWQALAASRRLGKPTVGFYESTPESQNFQGPVRWVRNLFFRQLDRVVVPGVAAARAVLDMGVDPGKVVVGFNAIDTDRFQKPPLVPTEQGHRFLYVGQLIPRKNVHRILRSFAEMRETGDRLTVVGKGEDTEELHALADELQIAGDVTWIPQIDNKDLPTLMGACETLVLASNQEVWGLVVNEALAAGMQVVVTRNCGVVESVEHMAGVFVASGDAQDLTPTMRAARDNFSGRIQDPEIIGYTPARFAETFRSAIEAAAESRPGKRTKQVSRA